MYWRAASLGLSGKQAASRFSAALSVRADSAPRSLPSGFNMTRGLPTIVNPLGLHARPAAKLVDCAARYTSEIRLTHQGQTIDAKSLMSVLMLAAPCGAILEVSIDGNDEQAAMEALEALFSTGFGELE